MKGTNDWRTGNKADEFLRGENEKRGQPFCTAGCSTSDNGAEALAADRCTGAALAAHREAQWWVYKLPDSSYTFTYPWVTEIDSHYGRPPDINLSIGSISSSGHIHWDGNNQFSGTDWRWVQNQKINGDRIPLFLSSGDRTLKYTNWNAAKGYGEGGGGVALRPPENFNGIVVGGVTINNTFDGGQ